MDYRQLQPHPFLRRYVQCFWSLQSSAEEPPAVERILPDGRLELVIHFGAHFKQHQGDGTTLSQPASLVAGQSRRPVLIEPTGKVGMVGVRFRPAGAYLFFQSPLAELTGRIVSLDLLWGRLGKLLEEQVAAAPTEAARIHVLETALLEQLAKESCIDPGVEAAVEMILAAGGSLSVGRMAEALGLSSRQLERKFHPRVGLAPKEFCRIVRFQKTFRALRSRPVVDWASLALACGYYDQPHFIRDFKEFAGRTPSSYFGERHPMSDFFTDGYPQA
jgi:AraC-like DNA-binding protein